MSTRAKLPPGTFGRYPIDLPRDRRLTPLAVKVVLLIEQLPQPAFPGQEWLAEQLGASARNVRSAIKLAEKCGYLKVQPGGFRGRYGRSSNHYWSLFPPRLHPDASIRMVKSPSGPSEAFHEGESQCSLRMQAAADSESHRQSDYSDAHADAGVRLDPARARRPGLSAARTHGTPRRSHEEQEISAPGRPAGGWEDDSQWSARLRGYLRDKKWLNGWGEPPGKPGCRVPRHLLVELLGFPAKAEN